MSGLGGGVDFEKLEAGAKAQAVKHVAHMLQRPDQLEKVDQIQRRVVRKKASCEAMLKTAVQSQLDGVRTGLQQLKTALDDCTVVNQNLSELRKTADQIRKFEKMLMPLRAENNTHRQLAAAVENLRHIFNVPEVVAKTEDLTADGKFLQAHKNLADLETARDDFLLELHRQPTHNPADAKMLLDYFSRVTELSTDLGKQLWLILQRTLITVRREPTVIVTALRIIEREEARDRHYESRHKETGFLPPGRPKRWREKCFTILQEGVTAKIEGSQLEDREQEKMWLVRHLENMRQIVLQDLKVVKKVLRPCFPPHYDILNTQLHMYHNAISQHLMELCEDVEGNEIVSLLNWINTYKGAEFMGNAEVEVAVGELGPLLTPEAEADLLERYLAGIRANLSEWMTNSLVRDRKDWRRESEPEKDKDGCFHTSLPIILFQMIEQNLQVASTIREDTASQVLDLCVDEMTAFTRTYKEAIASFRADHLSNREVLRLFIPYMIAATNNCTSLGQYMGRFRDKYGGSEMYRGEERFASLLEAFEGVARFAAAFLADEVLLDLEPFLRELMTRNWLTDDNRTVGTIVLTVDDYGKDFEHLKRQFSRGLVAQLETRVRTKYLSALCSKKITFKNYDERRSAAEKLKRDGDALSAVFQRQHAQTAQGDAEGESENEGPSDWSAFGDIAELLKMKDISMISLELSGLVQKYPSLHFDVLNNLLQMRGDVGRFESKQILNDCFGEDFSSRPRVPGIFSKVAT